MRAIVHSRLIWSLLVGAFIGWWFFSAPEAFLACMSVGLVVGVALDVRHTRRSTWPKRNVRELGQSILAGVGFVRAIFQSRRRWVRLSAWGLLLLAALSGILFGPKAARILNQRFFLAEVSKIIGVRILYDPAFDPTASYLGKVFGHDSLADIISIDIYSSKVSEKTLTRIGKFTHLKSLNLSGIVVGDLFTSLEGLNELQDLTVRSVDTDDKVAAQLKSLKALQTLYLTYSKITDVGLMHIAQMKQLTDLTLECEEVTDEGIAQLQQLVNLQSCMLYFAKNVPIDGIKKLQMALPKCSIICRSESGLVQLTSEENDLD